jgi:hypothetical protein
MLRTAVRNGLASELTAPDAAACSRDKSVRIAAVLGDAMETGSWPAATLTASAWPNIEGCCERTKRRKVRLV